MNTLKLTLNKKWFDLIEKGIKTEEYRELKDYWHKRMKFSPTNTKPFDLVEFTNGYNKKSPQVTFELVNIRLDTGKVEWGAVQGTIYYVLTIGREVARQNCL